MSIRLRSISVPNEDTFNELTYDAFWNEYINRNNLENDTLFEEAIRYHLTYRNNKKFCEGTMALFEEWDDMRNIAAVAELLSIVDDGLMLPVVKQLAYTVERRRKSFASLANREYLQTVVSCIAKYSKNHGKRENPDQMRLPMSYHNLRTLTGVIIIIEGSLSKDFNANLPAIDQLTRSQDTTRNFIELAKDVIHPCVVAEIALKWVRSTDLGENETGKVKDIIKTLLEELKVSSAQWYNSICNDNGYKTFIENHLGLPLYTESCSPQVLDNNGKNTLIHCINIGNSGEGEFTV